MGQRREREQAVENDFFNSLLDLVRSSILSNRAIARRIGALAIALALLGACAGCASTSPLIAGAETAALPSPTQAPTPAATPEPTATPTPTPLALRAPYAIAPGRRADLWFSEFQGDHLGRVTIAGEITFFKLSSEGMAARLVVGPDGGVWFTDPMGNRIGRFEPSDGTLAYYKLPNPDSGPFGITFGPDGNLWFTQHSGHRIGRLTPTGDLKEFRLSAGAGPADIIAGIDGHLWFVEDRAGRIGRIDTDGKVAEFPVPTKDGQPGSLTLGSDGNVWFTELKSQRIGKISPAGAVVEYPLPMNAVPFAITGAADGNLWITVIRGRGGAQTRAILKVSTAGAMTAFEPPPGTIPGLIAGGPDGNLWFTQPNHKIARLTPDGQLTTFDVRRAD